MQLSRSPAQRSALRRTAGPYIIARRASALCVGFIRQESRDLRTKNPRPNGWLGLPRFVERSGHIQVGRHPHRVVTEMCYSGDTSRLLSRIPQSQFKGFAGVLEELSIHAADLREFMNVTIEGTRSEVALYLDRLLQ